MLLVLLRNSAFFSVKIFLIFTWFSDIILLSKQFFWKNNFGFRWSILKLLCRQYVRLDLLHIGHLDRQVKIIYFKAWACLWYSFLYPKIVKIQFRGVLLSSILVCKISEFWRCKMWDQNFASFDSGNIHIKESKKPGFTFSFELRTKLVWSHGHGLFPERYFL